MSKENPLGTEASGPRPIVPKVVIHSKDLSSPDCYLLFVRKPGHAVAIGRLYLQFGLSSRITGIKISRIRY